MAKKETDDFEIKYENDICTSLEFDFDKYRNNIEDMSDEKPYWHITKMWSSEFTIRKYNEKKFACLEINYKESTDNDEVSFTVQEPSRSGYSYDNRKFNSKRINKIVEKYFFLFKLKSEIERKNKKIAEVQGTLDIIGKSSSRDSKINDILKIN